MPWNYGPPRLQRIVRGSEKRSRVIEIVKPKREVNNDFPLTIITIILVYTVYTSYFSSEYHNQGHLFVKINTNNSRNNDLTMYVSCLISSKNFKP